MRTPEPFRSDEMLDDEAAAWLCEREEGFAPGRARDFAAWCERNPRHAEAVARVEITLSLLAEMPLVREPLEARVHDTAQVPTPSGVRPNGGVSMPIWVTGIAAAVAIGAGLWWMKAPRASAIENYATEIAGVRRVALSDGTVVDMNAGSEMSVQFTGDERRVTLGAGEAHFQVAHNAARPFIVTAGGVSVRAVGTAFDVRLAKSAVEVLVVEGKVEVSSGAQQATPAVVGPVGPLLVAGQKTSVSRVVAGVEPPKVEKVDAGAMRTALTWQDQITSFTDVPLSELVMRFNRVNATQLTLSEPQLGERRVGGVIALDNVEAFVRLLEQEGDIAADRRATEIVLRRAR